MQALFSRRRRGREPAIALLGMGVAAITGRERGRYYPFDESTVRLQSPFGTPVGQSMAPTALDQRELGHLMFHENGTKALIESIDDAIEQAERLGLAFVADILMMARLEAVQADSVTRAPPGSDGRH